MEQEIKILVLVSGEILISQIEEVAALDIGQPDCKLTSPYKVALIGPSIDISFGTSAALGAFTAADGQCAFFADEPVVTITIK